MAEPRSDTPAQPDTAPRDEEVPESSQSGRLGPQGDPVEGPDDESASGDVT